MGVPAAVGMGVLLLGKPDGKGMWENPEPQLLEVRWRGAGKNIMVAQEKHFAKWEMSIEGHRDATGMRTNKSPSVVAGRGLKEEQFQCGRDEREAKKEKLYMQPA